MKKYTILKLFNGYLSAKNGISFCKNIYRFLGLYRLSPRILGLYPQEAFFKKQVDN